MDSIKNIIIVGIIVLGFINLIVNKEIREFIKKILNKKIYKFNLTVGTVILALFFVWTSLMIFSYIVTIVDNVRSAQIPTDELDETMELGYRMSDEERITYTEIMEQETDIDKCKNPYIPEGFKYIEGTWDTGYVIESEKGNQYVWIPCTNIKNNSGINILKRKDFSSNSFVKSFLCYEDSEKYEDFLNSALQNGGFYISRFEIGIDENGNPVSKMGYKIWNNITKEEAKEKATLIEDNINSELINGYAYDTAFSFIYDEIENTSVYELHESTGLQSIKNIYDMVDNVYELTTEMQFEAVVYRGIIPDNKYIDNTSIDNRLVTNNDYSADNLGFRTILYK